MRAVGEVLQEIRLVPAGLNAGAAGGAVEDMRQLGDLVQVEDGFEDRQPAHSPFGDSRFVLVLSP